MSCVAAVRSWQAPNTARTSPRKLSSPWPRNTRRLRTTRGMCQTLTTISTKTQCHINKRITCNATLPKARLSEFRTKPKLSCVTCICVLGDGQPIVTMLSASQTAGPQTTDAATRAAPQAYWHNRLHNKVTKSSKIIFSGAIMNQRAKIYFSAIQAGAFPFGGSIIR